MIDFARHNRLRAGVPLAAVALLGGLAACQSDGEPDPSPAPPTYAATSAPVESVLPSCEVRIEEVVGRTATLTLATEDIHGQFYAPESVDWVHGDGTVENVAWQEAEGTVHEHTFPNTGQFEVNAAIAFDTAEGAEEHLPIPLSRGGPVFCLGAEVTVSD